MSDASSLRRIKAVEALPGYRLRVTWERGSKTIVDLSDMVQKGGVFQTLSDKDLFSAVKVGENNRVLEWPSPADTLGYPIIEIDAESLIAKYNAQTSQKMVQAMRNAINAVKPARRIMADTIKS